MFITTKANDTTTVLHYLVREPTLKTDKPPVIILLHGVGSNEADLFSFADQLPGNYLVISARAPIHLAANSFAWYRVDFSTGKPVFNFKEEEKSRDTLIRFIAQLKEQYSLNEQEVYLCGFSQGAIMSYSIGLTRPDLVKGVMILSGRLLNEIKPFIKPVSALRQLRVFIAHGTGDSTLPVNYAREAKDYLQPLGVQLSYHEYRMEHQVTAEVIHDLCDWLPAGKK